MPENVFESFIFRRDNFDRKSNRNSIESVISLQSLSIISKTEKFDLMLWSQLLTHTHTHIDTVAAISNSAFGVQVLRDDSPDDAKQS